MSSHRNTTARNGAVARAKAHSPFLREAIEQLPGLIETFLSEGPGPAIQAALAMSGPDVEAELRQRRHGLALAVAQGIAERAGWTDQHLRLPVELRLRGGFGGSQSDQGSEGD